MSFTKTSIISLAIGLLGHKPIQTLDNADDLVIAAEQWFDLKLPSILSTGNWRFAIQIQQLSLSTIIPPPNTGWQNVYYLPSGYLGNVRIIPNNYVFEIYSGNLIYCNWGTLSPVYMEYKFMPPLSQLPPWFVDYFIYEIAAPLSLTNAQKPEYFESLQKQKTAQWALASATDAQNRPNFVQVDIPVLNNRNITGIIGPAIG